MKRKYIFILLSSLGLIFAGNINAQWISENSPTKNNLNSINLFDEKSGWIVGDNGTILFKDQDVWLNYSRVTNENLNSVFFINKYDGWAVGSNGAILRFKGTKWENFTSPTSETLHSVSFMDAEHGIAVGERGTVVTYDNGIWKMVEKATRGNLYAVAFKSDMSVFGGGLEAMSIPIMTMLYNSESTLVKSFDPNYVEIKGLSILNPKDVWAVGRPGTIFHFDGINWKRLDQFEKLPSLRSIYFSDLKTGMAVGYVGTVLTYSDSGWKKEVSPVNVRLNGAAISGNTFYAVGNNGTIISLWRKPEINHGLMVNTNSKIELLTFPNPSSSLLNIVIPEGDEFLTGTIIITNNYGQIILRKNLNSVAAGQNIQINTSNLSTGLYLIQMTTTGKTASGKFIVKH